jgi:hypothetical protein
VRAPRVKYLPIKFHARLEKHPNFSASGSVKGMRDQFYGHNALLVKSGSYIYNVTDEPELYDLAH